ncbi:MAG: tandem-95 repeat protein [Acidobacteria bacterium]|nr:tandem-95 repeat protein [Acidobacteriota bacterium]
MRAEAAEAIASLREIYDPRRLKPGQEISVTLLNPELAGDGPRLLEVTIEASAAERVEFAIAQSAAHGAVSEQTTATTTTGSETVTAASMVYTPNRDYSGHDTIRLRGCVPNACKEVAVSIQIIERNDAPIARDDFATGPEDKAIHIAFADLLDNDSDVDSTTLRIELAAQPSEGRVQQRTSSFIYRPAENWAGTTSFTYKVLDDRGGFDLAEVLITISARNDAPLARSETLSTRRNTSVTIAVLSNDRDPDGDPLSVAIERSSNGTATLSKGRIVFTPAAGLIGDASVRYRVTDPSGLHASATATIHVVGPDVHLSRSANHGSTGPLAGQTVTGWVWVFTDRTWTSAQINTVEFRLDGVFVNTQGSPSYDFGKGPNYGLDTSTMTTGAHTITMKTRFRDGGIHQTNATFVVTR